MGPRVATEEAEKEDCGMKRASYSRKTEGDCSRRM